jgi:hypothetical protein
VNTTVWYEQIDTGLIKFIQSKIKLTNKQGNKVSVPVRIIKPDEDFKVENYPMVTITNLFTSKRDEVRYYPFKVLRGINHETGKGNLEATAVPYSVHYQIDFWSTKQKDMNSMLSQWCFNVSRDFVLPVTDSGGNKRDTFGMQIGDSLKRQDRLNGNDRIFRSILTYKILAEIDEEDETNLEQCDIVTEIEVNTTNQLEVGGS